LGGLGMFLGGFGFHGQPEPPSSETLAAACQNEIPLDCTKRTGVGRDHGIEVDTRVHQIKSVASASSASSRA
jgi:K+-transporting ATPase c subunit